MFFLETCCLQNICLLFIALLNLLSSLIASQSMKQDSTSQTLTPKVPKGEESHQVSLRVLEADPKADLCKGLLRTNGLPKSHANLNFYFIVFLDVHYYLKLYFISLVNVIVHENAISLSCSSSYTVLTCHHSSHM